MQSKRVGYWWSEKKSQKINVGELDRLFVEKGYDFVKIDLESDIESQGPFNAIVHKLSDVMCKADRDENAARQIASFEKFVKKHPDIVVVDSLENVHKVLDRYRQYKIVEDSELAKEDGVFIPTFVELTSTDPLENLSKLEAASVKFPFVCKAMLAHGTKFAHRMSIIFNEAGLNDINPPCVAQTFINHNARLFKLFIIKDKHFVIERPSLKNFRTDCINSYKTVHFDSHDISKPYSSSHLTELDEEDAKTCNIIEPEEKVLARIVNVISRELGLYLLGIDVIIENETGRYAIIDINSFPGYDGVDNFLELYRDIVIQEIENKHLPTKDEGNKSSNTDGTKTDSESKKSNVDNLSSKQKNAGIYSSECDSGIDTSDSCDERKKSDLPVKANKRYHCRPQQTSVATSIGLQNVNEKS